MVQTEARTRTRFNRLGVKAAEMCCVVAGKYHGHRAQIKLCMRVFTWI